MSEKFSSGTKNPKQTNNVSMQTPNKQTMSLCRPQTNKQCLYADPKQTNNVSMQMLLLANQSEQLFQSEFGG